MPFKQTSSSVPVTKSKAEQAAKARLAKLQTQAEGLAVALSEQEELAQRADGLRLELKKLKATIEEQRVAAANQSKEMEKAKNDLASVLSKITKSQATLSRTEASVAKANDRVDKAKAALRVTKSETASIVSEKRGKEKELKHALSTLQDLSKKRDALVSEILIQEDRITVISAALEEKEVLMAALDRAKKEMEVAVFEMENARSVVREAEEAATLALANAKEQSEIILADAERLAQRRTVSLDQREGDLSRREQILETKTKKLRQLKGALEVKYNKTFGDIII